MRTQHSRGNRRRFLMTALIAGLLCSATSATADGLGDALRATLRHHPAVAGQQAQVQASRYAVDGARSQRYPTLTAQVQRVQGGDRSVLSGDNLSNPAVLRLRQPIWAFGRISSSIASANAKVNTEREDLLRVRRRLLENTAVAYVEVRGSRERIDIAERNVAELQDMHAQILRRVEGQLASTADARLAATRLAQARAQLQRFVSESEIARDDLTRLTQVPISADQPVPASLLELPESTDLIASVLEQSAEIRLKREQVNQAEADLAQARSADWPTIYLQAERFNDQAGLRDDSQISVVLEASLEGLGFAARGRRGEADSRRMAAVQDLATVELELRRELERLQRSRQLQRELIDLQTPSLLDLESLLASYQRQYEAGSKSWLDVLNIQRELFEQRQLLVRAQNDWQIYSLQLLARIGGIDDLANLDERNDG